MENILVIDIGTTSMKGIVYNRNATILAEYKVSNPPKFLSAVEVEQNPEDWKQALYKIVNEIRNKGFTYDAIAVTAQRSSVFPVNKDGEPIGNAIMWQDRRTEGLCKELSECEDLVFRKTGLLIKPIYGAPKICWMKNHNPQIYKEAYKFIVISDYVLYLLTRHLCTDYTYGNRMLLMNMEKCVWDDELIELFGIEKSKLCDLVEQGSLIGYTSKEFCQETGIKEGIPVFSAGGDQQCAALGLGVFEAGKAEITHGTGSFLMAHSDKVIIDQKKRISCNISAIPNKYFIEASFMTTGVAYDWFNKNFYDTDVVNKYEMINADVKEAGIGASGVVMLPHFQGTGSLDWNTNAKGLFFNLSLSSGRKDFARAILEGVAIEISKSLAYIEQNYGLINELSLSGGLANLEEFNQIQADVYKKKITTSSNQEATSLGAFISCAVSLGLYKDYQEAFLTIEKNSKKTIYIQNENNAKFYDALKEKTEKLYRILKESGIYSEYTEWKGEQANE